MAGAAAFALVLSACGGGGTTTTNNGGTKSSSGFNAASGDSVFNPSNKKGGTGVSGALRQVAIHLGDTFYADAVGDLGSQREV